jgi:hypothetical protein
MSVLIDEDNVLRRLRKLKEIIIANMADRQAYKN